MRLFRLISLALTAVALAACTNTPSDGGVTAPSHSHEIASTNKVVRATLDNGLQVVIVPNSLAPVATQQITYMVGGNQAPEGFPGIAHAQEHMMFRGAPDLTSNQLSGIYARMGGAMNAFTTSTTTSYFFTVPSDDIDTALHIGAIRMSGVNDFQKEWAEERGAIEQEVARDYSNPLRRLIVKMFGAMYAGTPYANSALGTKESFDKLTAAQLKKFYDTWYAPNNALLVVAGNVDPQAVLAKVKELYGDIPASKVPSKPDYTFAPVAATTFTAKSDLPVGIVIVGFRMPGYESPDYPAADLASSVLASKRGPIQALRFQGKLLFANFQMISKPDASVGLVIGVYPPGGDAQATKQALLDAVAKVRKQGIDKEVILAAKRRAKLDQQLLKNSISGLAMTWTNALTKAGLNSPAQALERLRAVSPAQVNALIQDTLNPEHAITLVANPTPGSKPTASSSAGGKESFASKPEGKVVLPEWAEAAFAQLPHPEPFLDPTDIMLDNGVRLIVQPLHVSNSISVYGSVHQKANLQAPKGQIGIGGVLASLFDWGPQGMTRQEFVAAQDRIGAKLAVGPSFSLKVLPQYFDGGVKLLANAMLNPALPKKAFKKQQFLQAKQAAGQIDSPKFKFQRAIQKALVPEGDPTLRLPTFQTIGSISFDDLKAYYDKVYRPDVTTIVVIGDVTPEKAKAVVKKYFGTWKAQGPAPKLDYAPIPLSEQTHVRVPDELKKQDQVVLNETLSLNYTNPDHFALELANYYLSGGFYATPLYRVLREELGLVYNVGSSFSFERNRGSFSLHYGSYPEKVNEAREAAIKVLKDTMAEPLTDEQLHLAKSIGLRRIQLSKQSVGAIARGWISRSHDGLPLDWSYVMARHFEELTAPEIQKVLNQYLDPERLSTIILGKPTK